MPTPTRLSCVIEQKAMTLECFGRGGGVWSATYGYEHQQVRV